MYTLERCCVPCPRAWRTRRIEHSICVSLWAPKICLLYLRIAFGFTDLWNVFAYRSRPHRFVHIICVSFWVPQICDILRIARVVLAARNLLLRSVGPRRFGIYVEEISMRSNAAVFCSRSGVNAMLCMVFAYRPDPTDLCTFFTYRVGPRICVFCLRIVLGPADLCILFAHRSAPGIFMTFCETRVLRMLWGVASALGRCPGACAEFAARCAARVACHRASVGETSR